MTRCLIYCILIHLYNVPSLLDICKLVYSIYSAILSVIFIVHKHYHVVAVQGINTLCTASNAAQECAFMKEFVRQVVEAAYKIK